MNKINNLDNTAFNSSEKKYNLVLQNISKNIKSILDGFSNKKKALALAMFLSISPSIAFGSTQYKDVDIEFKGHTQSLTVRDKSGDVIGYLDNNEIDQAKFNIEDIQEIPFKNRTFQGVSVKTEEENGYITTSDTFTNINDYIENKKTESTETEDTEMDKNVNELLIPHSGNFKEGVYSLRVRNSNGEVIEWLTKKNIYDARFFPNIKKNIDIESEKLSFIKVENVDGKEGYIANGYIDFNPISNIPENRKESDKETNMENINYDNEVDDFSNFNKWLSNEVTRRMKATYYIFKESGYDNVNDFTNRLGYVSDLLKSFEDKDSLYNFLEEKLENKFQNRSNLEKTLSLNIDNYFTQVRLNYQSQLEKNDFKETLNNIISYEMNNFKEQFVSQKFPNISTGTRKAIDNLKTGIENEMLKVASLLSNFQHDDYSFEYWINIYKDKYDVTGENKNYMNTIKEIFHKIRITSQNESLNGKLGDLKKLEEKVSQKKQRRKDEIQFIKEEIKKSHGFSNWSHQVNVAMNYVGNLPENDRIEVRSTLTDIYNKFRDTYKDGENAFDVLRSFSDQYNVNIDASPYSNTSFTYRIRHLLKEIVLIEKDKYVGNKYKELYYKYKELKKSDDLEKTVKENIIGSENSNTLKKMKYRLDLTYDYAENFLSEKGLKELNKRMHELYFIGLLSENPSNFFHNYAMKVAHDHHIPTDNIKKSKSLAKNYDNALTMLRVATMRKELSNSSGEEYLKLEEKYSVDYIINAYKITSDLSEYSDNIDLNKKYSSIISYILKTHPYKEKILSFFGSKEKAKDFVLKIINVESKGLTFVHAGDIGTNAYDKALGPIQALRGYRQHYKLNPFNEEEVIRAKFDQIIIDFYNKRGELRNWKDHPNRVNIAYQSQISGPTGTKNAIKQCGVYEFYECFSNSSEQQYYFLNNINESTKKAVDHGKLSLNNSFESKYEKIKSKYPQISMKLGSDMDAYLN